MSGIECWIFRKMFSRTNITIHIDFWNRFFNNEPKVKLRIEGIFPRTIKAENVIFYECIIRTNWTTFLIFNRIFQGLPELKTFVVFVCLPCYAEDHVFYGLCETSLMIFFKYYIHPYMKVYSTGQAVRSANMIIEELQTKNISYRTFNLIFMNIF